MRWKSIDEVVTAHMCLGCGACSYVSRGHLEMSNVPEEGLRPRVVTPKVDRRIVREELAVCPGVELAHGRDTAAPGLKKSLVSGWGPVIELREGFAAERETRFMGSSGGAATALALYCLEKVGMHGVLHIRARRDRPYLNETVLSTAREGLLEATGSRYAPASPCDGLGRIEEAPAPCVFIGKPCDVAAAQKARRMRPDLDKKLGLTIALFCAGTPSTRGTLEMLRLLGVTELSSVSAIRYRGMGWPGKTTVRVRTPRGEEVRELSYMEAWGDILQKYRTWRCAVCIDHTGEFADIAVGDPWYTAPAEGEEGRSLIVARTERGRTILHAAREARYIEMAPAPPRALERSQREFLGVRGKVWARILTSRLMGEGAPVFRNMPMFRYWVTRLNFMEKTKSFIGTIFRIIRRRRRDISRRSGLRDPVGTGNHPLLF